MRNAHLLDRIQRRFHSRRSEHQRHSGRRRIANYLERLEDRRLLAVWSDGRQEDVTCLTRFQTNDESVVQVNADGLAHFGHLRAVVAACDEDLGGGVHQLIEAPLGNSARHS